MIICSKPFRGICSSLVHIVGDDVAFLALNNFDLNQKNDTTWPAI